MSDPILDLLAAPPNPSMSVDEPAVYAGGRRRLRRRRLFTAAGAAAAALAVAGTIGFLAPRVNNDALPALPTPTVTPTPEVTPTITPSASPSATVTPSASVTATPNATQAVTTSRSPSSAPSRATSSSTPTPTTATGPGWSEPITVAGKTYRARLVPSSGGEHNYDLVMQRGSTTVFTPNSVYNTEGRWGLEEGDPRVAYYLSGSRLTDLISVKGEPVGDEVIGHLAVPTPDGIDVGGEPYVDLHVTIFRTTSANSWAPYGPEGWVVQVPGGGTWDLSED